MAARRPIPVHLQPYVDMVTKSRLLAPNLKTLTLSFFAGRANAGNDVAREVVRDHLLALRWMNPNAVVYLREERGQGVPEVQYELCECARRWGERRGGCARARAERVCARSM